MLELSQKDVAQALSTSIDQILKYEDGSQQIGTNHLDRLAAVPKVPASFLHPVDRGKLARISAPCHFQREVMDFLTSPDGLLLMAAFMQIKDRHIQRCIMQLIEQVARLTKTSGPMWLN